MSWPSACCARYARNAPPLYQPSPSEILRLGYTPKELQGARFRKGRGCPHCRHTGYKGRVGIFEMLVLNEAVRDGLIERKTSHQIRQISVESNGHGYTF